MKSLFKLKERKRVVSNNFKKYERGISLKRRFRFPKKTVITLMMIGAVGFSVPLIIKSYDTNNFNNYLSKGQEYLSNGDYKEAVLNFDNALKYNKNDNIEINNLIDRAMLLKQSSDAFDQGAELVYEKKYLEAINSFIKVSKEDDIRYEIAQEKIEECRKVFSDSKIAAAQNEAVNGKYEASLSYIDEVLKVDPLNQSAVTLKNQYNSLLTARIAEQQKKAQEQMAKQASGINLPTQ
jgi:tetratricopeptide (TPR) repeat protein